MNTNNPTVLFIHNNMADPTSRLQANINRVAPNFGHQVKTIYFQDKEISEDPTQDVMFREENQARVKAGKKPRKKPEQPLYERVKPSIEDALRQQSPSFVVLAVDGLSDDALSTSHHYVSKLEALIHRYHPDTKIICITHDPDKRYAVEEEVTSEGRLVRDANGNAVYNQTLVADHQHEQHGLTKELKAKLKGGVVTLKSGKMDHVHLIDNFIRVFSAATAAKMPDEKIAALIRKLDPDRPLQMIEAGSTPIVESGQPELPHTDVKDVPSVGLGILTQDQFNAMLMQSLQDPQVAAYVVSFMQRHQAQGSAVTGDKMDWRTRIQDLETKKIGLEGGPGLAVP